MGGLMRESLVQYIEGDILPRYDGFLDGHDRRHVETVIRESLYLAREHGADAEMAYVIAAYHDLGIPRGRSTHHLTSAAILVADGRLREWFDEEQLQVMKEAVEDHRASADFLPRTLYGCIVADADHFVEPEDVLRRTILYGKANYPELTREEQLERAREHVRNKFCAGGYLHFQLNDARSLEGLARLRELAEDDGRFDEICGRYL